MKHYLAVDLGASSGRSRCASFALKYRSRLRHPCLPTSNYLPGRNPGAGQLWEPLEASASQWRLPLYLCPQSVFWLSWLALFSWR